MSHEAKIWTKSFIRISITQFLIFIAFYTLLTTLPIFVIHELGRTEAEGGLVVTAMLLAAILIRPFSATFLQKIGKRKGLILSVAMYVATTFLYLAIDAFIPLLVLRFLHGISFGIVTTATGAIAADIIPPSRRGAGLGYFAMSMNLALVVGPFIGLTLLQYVNFQTLFLILSILMVIAIINVVMVKVSDDQTIALEKTKKQWSMHDFIELKALPIAVISSLIAVAYSSVMSFISVYANAIGLRSTASYFFLVFAAAMILSRPYLGRTYDVKGPKFVIIPCLFIFALGLISLSITNSSWMLLLSAALIGLGFGTLLPSFQTMAIQAASRHRSSYATSTFFILYDAGLAAGSYIWGIVISLLGFANLYLLSAVIVLVVIVLFNMYHTKRKFIYHKHSSERTS